MPGDLADLIRDAASLHQFIGSICKRRDEPERTHREATVRFLNYIRELGENSQGFVQSYVQRVINAPGDASLARFERQGLTTIRDFWSSLHELVRPAEDAHTLNIPVTFIEFLRTTLSRVPGLEGCDMVISHTSALNYFFNPRANLRYYAEKYQAVVGGSPPFPKRLALIEMPYSQGTSLFLNLVICHELGHFAFEELGIEEQLSREIDSALKTLSEYDRMSEPDLSWCRERLRYWSEEIYCDRFAIGLIGPAYSFAYVELFDTIGTSDTDDVVEFYDTHPADACRFKEHADQLRGSGWWSLLDESPRTSYVDLMRRLEAVAEADYTYDSEDKPTLAQPVLAAFLSLKPKIASLVAGTLQGRLRQFRGAVDRNALVTMGSRRTRLYLTMGASRS